MHLTTCARGKGAMARARYYVEVIGADNSYFAYTYHHFAPAFFFARDPEDREKQDFIQLLVDTILKSWLNVRGVVSAVAGTQPTLYTGRVIP